MSQVAISPYAAIHIYRQHEVRMSKQTFCVFAAPVVNALRSRAVAYDAAVAPEPSCCHLPRQHLSDHVEYGSWRFSSNRVVLICHCTF